MKISASQFSKCPEQDLNQYSSQYSPQPSQRIVNYGLISGPSVICTPSISRSQNIIADVCNSVRAIENTEQGFTGQWKTSSLLIVCMVIRFVFQLKTKIDSTKFKMLTLRIFKLIDDKASDYQILDNNRRNNTKIQESSICQYYCFQIKKKVVKTLTGLDAIMPIMTTSSQLLLVSQIIMVITHLVNLFYIPVNISFLHQADDIIFQMLPHIIFTLWIGICCNTAVYQDEILITNRVQILQFYYRNELIYDFLIVFPYYFRPLLNNYAELTFVLKVFQLQRILEKFEYNNNFKENITAIFDLIKLIIFLLFITHCCACAWHFLGIYERDHLNIQSNWLDFYNYIDNPWLDRYIISLYWSVITTLTVGYGDISPQTQLERLYVIFVAMILCGLLGYTVTSIGEIFKSINDKKMIYKQQMKAVNKLVKQRGLNTQLQIKVRKYFQHLFLREQEENNLGEQLMAKLTPNLEEEVLIDTYRKILKQSVLLKHFKDVTIDKLCTKVNIAQYAPGNEIIKCQTQSDTLFFLIFGNLNVLVPIQNSILKTLTPGFVIGEQEFAEHSVFEYSVISTSYSKVAQIKRSDFLKVLSIDSEETEKLCEIRDNCLFNPMHKNFVGRVCEICGWTHGYLKCPFAFIQLDRWKVVQQHNQSQESMRRKFNKRRYGRVSTLAKKDYFQFECAQFCYQNRLLDDFQNDSVSNSDSNTTPNGLSMPKVDDSPRRVLDDNRLKSQLSLKSMDPDKIALNQMKIKRTSRDQLELHKQNSALKQFQQQSSKISNICQGLEDECNQNHQIDDIIARLNQIIRPQQTIESHQDLQSMEAFEVPQHYNHYNNSQNMHTIVNKLNLMSPVSPYMRSYKRKNSGKSRTNTRRMPIYQSP